MANQKTLFINAKIWQPDGGFDEAFGIDGNKIDFTGTNKQALLLKPDYDSIIDLGGRLVLPGLIDGHMHLCYGSLMLKRLDARNVNSIESLKSVISKYVKDNPKSNWIIGSNINLNIVLKDFKPGKGNFVDKIYSEKPLYIANYDYHSGLCNTLVLVKTGLTARINEFSDSEVVKDREGNPVGIVKENALDYVFDNLPKPSLSQRCNAVRDFIKILHSYGITNITDITLIEDFEVYNKLYGDDKLKVRINSYIPLEEFENIEKHEKSISKINPDLLTINGFKAYYDGSLGSETALFSKNYKGKNHNGYKTDTVTKGILSKYARQIDKAEGQLIIHAIGDLAVTEVLDLYKSLIRENGERNSRHRIEHAQHILNADLKRFIELGVIASVQPLHLKYDIGIVKDKLPDELVNTTHNYKKLIETGAIINFGTDFPIVEVNPYENIKMAITRNASGEVFTPENSIDLHNCIKAYTINNAYSNFNENAIGSIKPGKCADFVIMEDNLFDMKPEDIGNSEVWRTYFDGDLVYSALN
ncbi:MAG TPA: amidohydrolase [Ignavibacteria bacterium]|nr:amidohydrolase [Ignavibacteria bacterium]